ncbi:glycoside hydrolase family 70 protein [Leuconostoc suionicum]|uniref:glycoside hydrolase family 70 protein n=1 Tax=Leuconostoc suionicum TaxID=1511761 RepID=UPI0024ACC36D|nr:glycoside hydrolase family 70 protein [Leuconostoc suionicum]MDI6498675.1 glycoside hydrolase family 70 protein [Leuconostoc suionicum]MDI6500717.1 glycoside hydrolase family 70 protein [Leuconostoc suionicum]MDI6502841.1 glycoside hydrolase family 70 protein [Leuconostoc suionicum]MDI6614803.1 glycoside hydrolase family 70 protein [Leuconostoc suionicum]MDI6665700.1 glycoside hydrolase family 70 protein [Leuconostoc suionicum]
MRKKMYKSGKVWVAAMMGAVVAASVGATNVVHADTTTNTTVNTQVAGTTPDTITTTNPNNPTDPTNNQSDTVKVNTDDKTTVAKNNTAPQVTAKDTNGATVSQSTTTVTTTPNTEATTSNTDTTNNTLKLVGGYSGDYKTNDNGKQQFILKSTGKPVTGLKIIDSFTQYFSEPDGEQVKGAYQTVNGDTYYFDAGTGNAVKGTKVIDGKLVGFDTDGKLVKTGFVTNSDGTAYYFRDGNIITGLQTIDGKTYLFTDAGQVTKGGQSTIDGVSYYFDAVDGHATISNADQKQYTIGLTTQNDDFTPHNQIVSVSSKTIDNVDGFITADAWYQPKDIYQNGETWVASQTTDTRPLLMTWWPDVQTQVDYINFMLDQQLGSGSKVDAINYSQTYLNQQAENIQVAIEKRIYQEKSVTWLKTLMEIFRNGDANWKGEANWNITSEMLASDHLQGGALTYQNSTVTPNANSAYRLMNRTPTQQTGVQDYFTNNEKSQGGYELLLANDIDNSNPVVQAEQLNWLYYLMNFGSITASDSDANFDSFRVDAVDNVDADLLKIAADYMKLAYGTNQNDANSNQHLSILEDWDANDFTYVGANGNNQLTMDNQVQTQLVSSLTKQPNTSTSTNRSPMSDFISDWHKINRVSDDTENTVTPNYSFISAHDSDAQNVIAKIIQDLYPNVGRGLTPTDDQMATALKIYNDDQNSTDKHYTKYNLPAAYAILLTNKDTVPRVYYGDLYTEDGQYMTTTTPYYDAITTLMEARVKYVAGAQTTAVDKNDVLTTVRTGKGILNAQGQDTSGMGVIVSNNPDLDLSSGGTVVLHMGATHANQYFRPVLLSTKDGLKTYSSDDGAPTLKTDRNGDLIFDNSSEIKSIYGVSDPQVSGYLSVWVPVGASDTQDARSLSEVSTAASTDGNTLHSNAALDSNLIYEGFSNFLAMPTQTSEYANVKIAEKANLFKSWGITSFQFAPQYRSSTNDKSFLDSIIKNGYAFTDRYDLGFNTPTKYGTDQQLRDAIKAVHSVGIQAMADWVTDQIYNLPIQEAVTATRTDSSGNAKQDSTFNNLVYAAKTVSSGTDYQSKYGGAFLDKLKTLYPSLFTTKQVSTGEPINGDVKITSWSAKYFNGTNIQGQGAYYVLKDWATNEYFNVSSVNAAFLPKQLTNQTAVTGFVVDDKGVSYYSLSGYQAKNSFIEDNKGNWYYFDASGYMVTGEQTIDGVDYYFLPNGIELRNHEWTDSKGLARYSASTGQAVKNVAVEKINLKYVYSSNRDILADGFLQSNGQWYWFENGQLYTGFKSYLGTMFYFQNGVKLTNQWVSKWGNQYYLDYDGKVVQGMRTIDGVTYDFGTNSTYNMKSKVTGYLNVDGSWKWYDNGLSFTGFRYYMGTYYFFENGIRQENKWETAWGMKYYVGSDGRAVQGIKIIDGQAYDFGTNGTYNLKTQPTGYYNDGQNWKWYENGKTYTGIRFYQGAYYYFKDGVRQDNQWVHEWGYTYYVGNDGRTVQGWQTISGKQYNFGTNGTYYLR